MTDVELEKVIKGILGAINDEIDEPSYPYFEESRIDTGLTREVSVALLKDALDLLKAQEPRMMTAEEVVGNIVLGRDVILWFEFSDSIKELNAKDIEYNDYLCDDDMPTFYEPNLEWWENGYHDGVIVAEYNDVFRCWTSCPDQATREAVKWEK